ncbi:SH3 domain-containing protein [Paracoccus benzoatiresistens]|uniref:SH3 domain-containing protein n=1 Tax=Paracoccus benzoatiresistens TaxID=2997341 RepID=A0ABT4J2S1_9RHOB|nr:SH3 domain-containing protein [Paracoccus sp. EF6]MCZ0961416.1 SH3 domain-containing protein [Paracoccus sp. EF6]
MIRLVALMLATLAGLFLVLSIWGDGNLRAERRPAPAPAPALQPAAQQEAPPPPAAAQPPAAPAVVQASTQTPQQVQRFPGPVLRPSPEHAGEAPAAVATPLPEGPVLYVTGDRVNMRAGPSTGDRVVTALTRGAAVQPLGPTDAEWVNIRDTDGRVGYVASRFLSQAAP